MQAQKVINGFRLSPQQKRLWLLQQDNPIYRVQCAIRIKGAIEIAMLKVAVAQVIDRYEILRTSFQRPAGIKTPLQVIAQGDCEWQAIDLSSYDTEQQALQIETLFQQEQCVSFDWQQASLLRASLLTLSEQESVLLLSLPALCADSWSIPLLVQAICQAYGARLSREESDDVQYVQFAEWQNQLLEEDAAEGLAYWNDRASRLTTARLPFEKPQTSSQFAVKSVRWNIPSELVSDIAAVCQATDSTLSSFLLACWQVLLWRFSGESDLTIAITANGRKYEELETTIGLLAQCLPVSCSLSETLTFTELLQQVQASIQEAEQWQEYFTCEQGTNTQTNAESLTSPFHFDFQQLLTTFSTPEVSFTIEQQFVCIDRFKLKLSCIQQKDTIAIALDYDANVFDAEDLDCLVEPFQTLITSAIANPKAAIYQLELLNDRARHQLLVEFNNTSSDFPQDRCVHQLFETQAARTPDQVALVFEDQQLTYAELNARANQLAHYLQTLGVQPENLVGIYLERSLETIVSLLGILKSGAAYLPLDPAFPVEALSSRVQDAQPIVLLTQATLLNSAQAICRDQALEQSHPHVVCLNQDADTIAQHSTSNPLNRAAPANLVYVIYTSGSTGQPKGVAIEHRNLLNYLYSILERLSLPTGAHFATVSTLAADLGNTAIFAALCSGGCLHVMSSDRVSDPQAFTDYCQRHPIDCLKIVPSHLEALLTAPQSASILPHQCLVLGGEATSWSLIQKVQQYAPNCRILNHYGPTEATVGVLTYAVPQSSKQTGTVPLGQRIANTQIYLLDRHLQPVPIGMSGELYIGGHAIARGYLHRPDLTQERFIPHPFTSQPGSRLYKTGDLARYLPNGTLEFLGRIDNQVKIRGYRVELGEIAATLRQHPSVMQAVVVQQQNEASKGLIAYIVAHPGGTIHPTELRHFVQQKLPEYMVPSAFVPLKSLPLTANGKIDHQALPEQIQSRSQNFVAPRTPIEAILADIWLDLLQVPQISVHDSFFELGGHSLLMTQLLVRVREAFQVDFSLSRLFTTPTIAGLAEQIDRERSGEATIVTTDLAAEAVLDSTIQPASPFIELTPPTQILLTGATGFLGAFLLHELLQQTTATVYCLVRSANLEAAQKKLQKSLETYALWQESFRFRIVPVLGELAQPRLGLSEKQFQELTNQLDAIYHNGALVNFTYPYAALKPANVLGTQEILRLASQGKIKPVHFISTTNAVSPKQGTGMRVMHESDFLHPDEVIETGYAQSKWVAEQLVLAARDRGLPVCIYRPGRISWDSRTGIGSTSDNTFRMIKGCIQLGSIPQRDTLVNLTPVDFASKAIVQLSQQSTSFGKVFHLVNPHPAPWSQVIDWVRSLGYSLREVSDEQWRQELRNLSESTPDHALHPLVPFLTQQEPQAANLPSPTLQFDCQNTLSAIAETSLRCPPVNAELVRSYFSFLVAQNRLEASKSL